MRDIIENDDNDIITIEILRSDRDPNGNLPSLFFPGAGSDGALFQVVSSSEAFPDYNTLCDVLRYWDGDSMLTNYDKLTGQGYFRLVDSYAPKAGAVIAMRLMSDNDDQNFVDEIEDWMFDDYVDPVSERINHLAFKAKEEINLLCSQALQRISNFGEE